jgi:uncharacterized protein (DUF58 family)
MVSPVARDHSWQPPGLTLQGWVTAGGGVLWSLIAGLTGQRDLIWPGLFLVALPLASWLLLAVGSRRPQVERVVTPGEVTAGDQITSRIEVDPAGLPLSGAVHYSDTHPEAVHGPTQASLPPGVGRHRIEHRLTVVRRGRHRLGPLRHSVTDALGLARAQRIVPAVAEVLALPRVHPLDPQRAASGLGSATESTVLKTSLVGSDDVLVREYLPGDDVRRIHWRSTARTGELMVRREEQAWDPSAVVLLDNRSRAFGRTEPDPRFEWLVSAAASIAVHLIEHGFAVGVTDARGVDPAQAQRVGARTVIRRLADADLTTADSLEPAVATAPTGARGQLLIALLGRLDAADGVTLAAALRDHQACWALILDPAKIDPDAALLLQTSGWRVLRVPAGTPVAGAWQLLGEVSR